MLGVARLFALAVMILIGLAPAQTALAHASLISSQPEDGAVLAASPSRVILIFNEPVAPLRMQVIDRSGEATPAHRHRPAQQQPSSCGCRARSTRARMR